MCKLPPYKASLVETLLSLVFVCIYIHVYIFFLCFFIYLFIHFFLRLLNIDLTLCKEIYNRVPECKVANLALQYKHSANANKDATKIPRERKGKEKKMKTLF